MSQWIAYSEWLTALNAFDEKLVDLFETHFCHQHTKILTLLEGLAQPRWKRREVSGMSRIKKTCHETIIWVLSEWWTKRASAQKKWDTDQEKPKPMRRISRVWHHPEHRLFLITVRQICANWVLKLVVKYLSARRKDSQVVKFEYWID